MRKKILLLICLIFSLINVSYGEIDYQGDFSSRSIIMQNLFGDKERVNQELNEKLKEKKLAPTAQCLIAQIKKNNIENVKLLLDYKVSPNNSYMSDYPVYIAAKENNFEMVKLLCDYGAKLDRGFNSELYEAVKNKNEQMAQYFIERNPKVNYIDPLTNNTILYYAIKNNMQDIVQSLVKKGVRPDMKSLKLLKKNKKMLNLIQDALN